MKERIGHLLRIILLVPAPEPPHPAFERLKHMDTTKAEDDLELLAIEAYRLHLKDSSKLTRFIIESRVLYGIVVVLACATAYLGSTALSAASAVRSERSKRIALQDNFNRQICLRARGNVVTQITTTRRLRDNVNRLGLVLSVVLDPSLPRGDEPDARDRKLRAAFEQHLIAIDADVATLDGSLERLRKRRARTVCDNLTPEGINGASKKAKPQAP